MVIIQNYPEMKFQKLLMIFYELESLKWKLVITFKLHKNQKAG